MIFGLAGASGTGKTTLAKLVSDGLNIPYLPTSITECARKHGYDAVGFMSLDQRIDLQWHLLNDHVEMINAITGPAILDRTPVDMIGYCMAEFTMQTHTMVTPKQLASAERYVSECLRASEKHYDSIFLLSRLSIYDVASTRPAFNPAYQRHTDLIMKGALSELGDTLNGMVIAGQNLDFRYDYVQNSIVARMDAHEKTRKSAKNIH